jgi:hypothetical protein
MAFRHMAENRAAVSASQSRRGVGLAMAALLTGALLVLPVYDTSAREATAPAGAAVEGEASRAVREVLSDPVFGRDIEETRWVRRVKDHSTDEKKQVDSSGWFQRFLTVIDWLSRGLRGVLYVIMALALVLLLVVLYRYSERFAGILPKRATRAPKTLFGLDLRPASLPDDIAAAAWAEAEAGRFAAALSLLYRGALVALIERDHVPFRDGDTENVCLQRVAGSVGQAAYVYFSVLLEAWKASAYAGSPPALANVRVLCQEWKEHFAGLGDRGAP